jgi:hypothetical protein
VEFETSDGEVRRLPAGKAVLVEDTHGKGHISRPPRKDRTLSQSYCRAALAHHLISEFCCRAARASGWASRLPNIGRRDRRS